MKEPRQEVVLQGITASAGVAQGEAFVCLQREPDIPIFKVDKDKSQKEIERFEQAIIETREEITALRVMVARRLSEEEARIFDAHLLVLEDQALIEDTVREHDETGYNIEYCFHNVARRYIDAFDCIDDEYIKERVSDIRDVTRRLLHRLLGHRGVGLNSVDGKRVVVAEYLSPSDAATLDREKILALATNMGARTSHAVIMARSLQVPAVVGLHDATSKIENGDHLLVDGYEGLLIINPTEQTCFRYSKLEAQRTRVRQIFETAIPLPAETRDKHTVHLEANIENMHDVDVARRNDADGVGLFRTEGLFLSGDRFPTEEEQFQVYKEIVQAMASRVVVIRTLDLGGDKRLTGLLFPEIEDNPFMGFRAIRFCLKHRDIFKDQLRAILRASAYGSVKMMYPMISGVNEFLQANKILEEAKSELREQVVAFDENIPVGAMIEIPSAAVTADLLAEHAAFFSIGTNDLIQYLLAVDRVNERIAHLYEPKHPAVLRMLKYIIDSGHSQGIPVSICGEMAGDALHAPLLIGLGADSLSLSPGFIPEVKYLLRECEWGSLVELAATALQQTDSRKTYDILQQFYFQRIGDVFD